MEFSAGVVERASLARPTVGGELLLVLSTDQNGQCPLVAPFLAALLTTASQARQRSTGDSPS